MRTVRLIISLLLLSISLPLLVWGFWPPRHESVTMPLSLPVGMPSLPEARTIMLEYAPLMRTGDSQVVRLNLSAGTDSTGGDFYEANTVIAEARLELQFADVRPADVVSAALTEGGAATFYWEVNPREVGDLRGTAWLYLRFVPKAGGEEARQPVSAQLVEIRSMSMLGRTGSEARVVGVIGFIVGLGMGISFVLGRRTSQNGVGQAEPRPRD